MAATKITSLTPISTIDTAVDPLPIVDVSDTSQASSGTTKKVTVSQIASAINSSNPAIYSGTTTNPNGVVTGVNGSIYFDISNPAVPVQWVKTGASWEVYYDSFAPGSNALVVDNVAAIKALVPSTLIDGQLIQTRGYYTENDGGQGSYTYDSTSAAADNGGTVIAPTSGSGRYLLQYSGLVNVKQFGAKTDGTNCLTAFTNALAACKNIFFPDGTFSVEPSVSIPVLSNTTLKFSENCLIQMVYPSVAQTQFNGSATVFNCTSVSNVIFDGLKFNGGVTVIPAEPGTPGAGHGAAGTARYAAIRFRKSSNCSLVNSKISYCFGEGVIIFSSELMTIENTDFEYCGYSGLQDCIGNLIFSVEPGAYASLVPSVMSDDMYLNNKAFVSNCTFKRATGDGVSFVGKNGRFDSCISEYNGRYLTAANLGSGGLYWTNICDNLQVTNFYCQQNGGQGFDNGPSYDLRAASVSTTPYRSPNVSFIGCTSVYNGRGGFTVEAATNLSFINCYSENNYNNPIVASDDRSGITLNPGTSTGWINSNYGVEDVSIINCRCGDTRAGGAKTQEYGVKFGERAGSDKIINVEIVGCNLSGNKLGAIGAYTANTNYVTSGYLKISNTSGYRSDYAYNFSSPTSKMIVVPDDYADISNAGAGAATITGIAAGYHGQKATLHCSGANTIVIKSSGSITSTDNIQLQNNGYANFNLTSNNNITLVYNSNDTWWRQI